MSAITTDIPRVSPSTRPAPTLRPVSARTRRVRAIPFGILILLVLGASMAGTLLISTQVQAQSAELGQLEQRAAALGYQQAALEAEVQYLESTQNVADRAWELGMRPNPGAPFLEVETGHIVGVQEPVNGGEVTGLTPRRGG